MSLYGNSIYGNSILLVESDSSGGGGGGGNLDHIESPDLSSSVTCDNGGIITSVGIVNFTDNSLNRVTALNGSASVPLVINGTNSQISLGSSILGVNINTLPRLTINAANNSLVAPDGVTGYTSSDDLIGISTYTGGPCFAANNTSTIVEYGTSNLTLDSTGAVNITSSGKNNSTFNTDGSVIFNQGNGKIVTGSSFEVLSPTTACIAGFTSVAAQTNIQLARINGTLSSKTQVTANQNLGNIGCRGWNGSGVLGFSGATIQFIATENYAASSNTGARIQLQTAANGTATLTDRMTIDQNGFIGININTPTSQLHLVGPSGTTLRIIDTNQAVGKVLSCIDTLGNAQWSDFNTLVGSIGYIYHEDAINAGTAISAMVLQNTKYLVNIPTTLSNSTNFTMPSNGTLQYTGAVTKTFKIQANISFQNDNQGSDPRYIYFWIYKNGSIITGASSRSLTLPGAGWVEESVESVVSLSTNDTIQLYTSNQTTTPIVTTAGIAIGVMQIIVS